MVDKNTVKENLFADNFCFFAEAQGNESGGTRNLEVCLFPWQQDTLPDDEDVARIFTFNEEMVKNGNSASHAEMEDKVLELEIGVYSPTTMNLGEGIYADEYGNAGTLDFLRWLQKIFVPSVNIFLGSEKMNPVPYFILTRLAPGWVGGFITWVTNT